MDTHLLPINKTAALVVSKGTHFEPKIKPHCHDERDILPLTIHNRTIGGLDLTGYKSGNLTVIGLSLEKKKRWICRCVCGKYVFRTAKSLRRNKNIVDKCISCNKLDYLTSKTSSIKNYYNIRSEVTK
jgi:hypothetical protein